MNKKSMSLLVPIAVALTLAAPAVRAARLDQNLPIDARREKHDGEHVARIGGSAVEGKRHTALELRREMDDLRSQPRMQAQAARYIDLTDFHGWPRSSRKQRL